MAASGPLRAAGGRRWPGAGRRALGVVLALLLALPALTLGAAQSVFAQRAEEACRKARASHRADPANDELAWRFARACFDWAE